MITQTSSMVSMNNGAVLALEHCLVTNGICKVARDAGDGTSIGVS